METKRKCIFIFGATRFNAQFESTSYMLAKELAKNNHIVYYIEYPFTIADKIKLNKITQFKFRNEAMAGKNDGIIPSGIPNLNIIIIPPLLSIHFLPESKFYRKLLNYNERIILKRLKRIIKKYALKDIIYINSFVFHYPNLANYLMPALSIYHCVDPVITPYDIKHGKLSEKILVNISDVIICTSRQLFNEKKLMHPNTYFIPNAADIRHSIRAMDPNLPIHKSLKDIKKPIAGYFGNIERRINFDLIREVALRNKKINFVFSGPVEKHLVPDFFFEIPNIHFTGRIPYAQMPEILKGFDVALIPFKKNEESGTVFPLKLFEYLGAGKPVIATDFNLDLQNFTHNLVKYCSNSSEFSFAINEALENDSLALQKERIELASHHTWEKRVLEIENIIDKHFTKATAI